MLNFINMLFGTVLFSLATSSIFINLSVLGILRTEYSGTNSILKTISRIRNCDWCSCFWISLILCVFLNALNPYHFFMVGYLEIILIFFLSLPITRFIIS